MLSASFFYKQFDEPHRADRRADGPAGGPRSPTPTTAKQQPASRSRRRKAHRSARTCSSASNYTYVDSEVTRCRQRRAPSADVAGAPPRRHLEEPLQHHDRGEPRRLFGPPAAGVSSTTASATSARWASPTSSRTDAQLARLRLRQALPNQVKLPILAISNLTDQRRTSTSGRAQTARRSGSTSSAAR